MELQDLKVFEGKKVWVILNNNFEYNGIVNKVDDAKNGLIFLYLTDKFGKSIIFASGEIKQIQEKQ